MIETTQNTIETQQVDVKNPSFVEWVLAIQQDVSDYGFLFQTADMAKFPETPVYGGILKTRKGCYEAIYTDAIPEVGQWRSISSGTIYAINATIPTTL